MAKYSDTDKILAIQVINRYDGNVSQALDEIRKLLQNKTIAHSTVYRWWVSRADFASLQDDKKNEAPIDDNWAKKTLDDYFEKIAYTYLDQAVDPDVVAKTSGNQAVMTAAVAVDKMRLLRNLPTEIVSIMPDLMASIKALGKDPYQFLQLLKDKLDKESSARIQ